MFRRAAPALALMSFLLVAVAAAAAAVPGDLDGSFSTDGKATTNFTTGFDSASAVLVQGDTKIVAVGMAAGNGGRFALVRYASDGILDTSFGGGDGKVVTDFTSGFEAAFDGALDAAENIIAVGRAGGSGGRFAIARYTTDGTLDPSFGGGDGKVTTNFTSGDDFAFSVAIQPSDGKIVVAGRAGGSGGVVALARYTTDGTQDTSFGGDGKVTTNITSGDDRADAVAVRPLVEKIVVVGTANYFGANGKFAVAQYNEDGTPDTSFSTDGKLTTDFTSAFDGGFALAIPPSGKIVAAGQAGGAVGLASYDTDGSLDLSFGGGDGKLTTNFTKGADYFDDLLVDANGKIVAGGSANFFGPNSRFALARYNADGTLDTSFSGNGKLTTDFTTGFDGIYGVAVTPDAKIVAGGYGGGSGGRFAVARYVG
ncbi:MAG TPA: hypothetical protein VGJ34_03065 [Gaiellaceae bacterium]|jgi:uncharacterized delta-60 repeat protein